MDVFIRFRPTIRRVSAVLAAFEAWNLFVILISLGGFAHVPSLMFAPCVMASVACSDRHGCHQRRLGLCVAGVLMKRQRSEKKNTSAAPATSKILPMELRVGDRLIDETGEWEVIGRPYTTAGGRPRTSASRGSVGRRPARSGSGVRTSGSQLEEV